MANKNKSLKILIFFNNTKGYTILSGLRQKRIKISKVFLSNKNLNRFVVKKLKSKKIKFNIIKKLNKNFINRIKKMKADLSIVAGFPLIFPKDLIKATKFGAINLHSGPLPEYRGGSPLNWQIINNEKNIGITAIKMNHKIDQGDILSKKNFILKKNMYIKDVHNIANRYFIRMFPSVINDLIKNKNLKKQNKKKSRYFSQRKPENGLIKWKKMNSLKVYNTIRALSNPYPNAFTYYKDNKIKISKSKILNYKLKGKPGYFKKNGEKIVVNCLYGRIVFKTKIKKLPYEGYFN